MKSILLGSYICIFGMPSFAKNFDPRDYSPQNYDNQNYEELSTSTMEFIEGDLVTDDRAILQTAHSHARKNLGSIYWEPQYTFCHSEHLARGCRVVHDDVAGVFNGCECPVSY